MSTKVYLGYPSPNVRRWIEEEYRKKKTIITFDDESTEEYDWTGEVNQETFIEAGIYDSENYSWLKSPVSIQFGTTVATVGGGAFIGCSSLTSVSMPNVITVGGYAFAYCHSLVSVSMPSVTTVGEYAFNECCLLVSISMPNVTTVGEYAFQYISTSAEFESQTTSTIEGWFGNRVFGEQWGPVTVTCSDGSVYAECGESEYTWTITITPA